MKLTSPALLRSRPLQLRLLLAGSLFFFLASVLRAEEADCDNLTINAVNVPVQQVLDELAETCNLRLMQQAVISRPVNIDIEGKNLAGVLDEVLETSDSYLLFLPPAEYLDSQGQGVPGTLWVFAAGNGKHYAMDFLETVLLRGNVGEKKQAIRQLRLDGTVPAVHALSFALGDEDERIRNAASEALAAIGSDEALAAIGSMAHIGSPLDRAAAAQAIAASGNSSAEAYLDQALADDDLRVRMAATDALAGLDNEAGRHRLRAALEDPDPAVREQAAELLENLDDEAMFHTLFPQHQGQRPPDPAIPE